MIDTLVILNLFGFVVLFVMLYVVILLYFRMRNTYLREEKLLAGDEKLKSELTKKIEEIARQRVEEIFEKASGNVNQDIKKHIDTLADLASKKGREISEFVTGAQKDQITQTQFFVANSLAKIEKETEAYRKNKLTKVDEEIRQIVLAAARDVIGRAISLSEHEDLVTKALEKAKREQIFT